MKNKTKTKVKKTNFIGLVGMLLIGFAIIDFAMSWMGTNLTAFLGPVSKFSAMITGFIGISFLNAGNAELEDR